MEARREMEAESLSKKEINQQQMSLKKGAPRKRGEFKIRPLNFNLDQEEIKVNGEQNQLQKYIDVNVCRMAVPYPPINNNLQEQDQIVSIAPNEQDLQDSGFNGELEI